MQGKKMLRVLALMCALLVMMCASALAATNWEDSYVEVEGTGVTSMNARNAGQAQMLARRAAIVDAYRQLAEQVAGVQVDSETTVEDMSVSSDIVKTRVSALVQGATIVKEGIINNGQGYAVTMRVNMYGVTKSVASAVLPENTVKQSFPAPVAGVAPSVPQDTNVHINVTIGQNGNAGTGYTSQAQGSSAAAAPTGQAIGGYTGLIVDCSGLGLKPAMSPVIKNDQGQAIYGYKNLDYDKVVENGMAGYTTDISRASRAGSHPLVVKAVRIDGANPVLSTADANRVLIENGATGFLDATNVVFVR